MAQPKPMSNRLAPVILAATLWVSAVTARVAGSKDSPASQARMASIAYSGKMVSRARIAMARDAEMSSSATSAAQESKNAPARMPTP